MRIKLTGWIYFQIFFCLLMQKPVMVVCPSPNYFIGQSLDPAWAVDLRGERQVRKRSNRFVRDRIGTYLEQVAKSPDPPNTRDTSSQASRPPACRPGSPRGQGLGGVTRSLLCPLSSFGILSSGAPQLPLSPPWWCPRGWPAAEPQSWCQGTG